MLPVIANAVGIINSLLPFLAVTTVVILVLMILIGLFHKESGDNAGVLPKQLKTGLMVVVVIAVVIAVMISTGAWDYIKSNWFSGGGGIVGTNLIFAVIIIAAIAVALWPMGKPGKESGH